MSLEKALNVLKAKYGPETVMRASEAKGLTLHRFSTGSVALDYALRGGLPVGRIINYVGESSSGKSTMALKAAGCYLRKYPDAYVVYLDMEHSYHRGWSKRVGADPKRVIAFSPASGEECAQAAVDALAVGDNCVVIIDSVAAMVTAAEIEGDMDKNAMGKHPAMIGKMVKKITAAMKRRLDSDKPRPTVFCLNQKREKIGVMWGNPEHFPGGHGLKHGASVTVRFHRKEWITVGDDETKENVGMVIGFKTIKDKVGGLPESVGTFTLMLKDHEGRKGGAVDNVEALIRYGLAYKIITANGRTYVLGKKKLAVGKDGLDRRLRGDKAARIEIRKALAALSQKSVR